MQRAQITSAFDAVLLSLLPIFTAPSGQSFLAVAWGWILCLGRPTMPRIVRCAGALLLQILSKVRLWLPGRELGIVADGAYPSEELVRALPPGVHLVSRIRRDAALYRFPVVPRRRRRGRPRQMGPRLPSLEAIMLLPLRLADWNRRIRKFSLRRREMRQFRGAPSVFLASAA